MSNQPILYGLPQISVIYPILFNIYLKVLDEDIHHFRVRYNWFLDDNQVYISTLDSTITVKVVIQHLL